MAKDRTQLNINIDPELLLQLKQEAIKNSQTLTQYVTEQLRLNPQTLRGNSLEDRLSRIEESLGLKKKGPVTRNNIGVIFTDQGARQYGEVARVLFNSFATEKGLSTESALKELAIDLNKYEHSDPELVFQILLGNHALTGLEMTLAYRKGSCAMRSALCDWCNDPLEALNEAFLGAVITKSLNLK